MEDETVSTVTQDQIEDETTSAVDQDQDQNQKNCIACQEPIMSNASICPHCLTAQSPKKWKSFGDVMKWLGGVTAVLSLIIGVVQLSGVLKTMRERSQSVNELARAAEIQFDMADYSGALLLINQALDLEPGSRQARKIQLKCAMKQVRNFTGTEHIKSHSFNREDYSNIINPLIPVLHRGAADKKPSNAADALAHIGWANHLRMMSGDKNLNPAEYFEHALAKESTNAFAHAMWATMCATKYTGAAYLHKSPGCGDDYNAYLETARKHYAAAINAGQNHEYVDDIRLKSLLFFPDRSAGVHVLDLVQEIRKNGKSMSMKNKFGAIATIQDLYMLRDEFFRTENQKLMHRVKVTDALSAAEWLYDGIDYKKLNREHIRWSHRLLLARLNELAGKSKKAIEMYRLLRLHNKGIGGGTFRIRTDIDMSLMQLLNIKRGALGVKLKPIDAQSAQNLGLQDTKGAIVEEVTKGGGAEKAGIKEGDVILSINGISYDGSYLKNPLGTALVGEVADVIISRDGQQQTLSVTLGERDPSDLHHDYHLTEHHNFEYLVDRTLYGAVRIMPMRGDLWVADITLWVADITNELRKAFNIKAGVDGVVVIGENDSELQVGQVILEIDGLQVSDTAKTSAIINDALSSGKSSIPLTLLEKGKRMELTLKLIS